MKRLLTIISAMAWLSVAYASATMLGMKSQGVFTRLEDAGNWQVQTYSINTFRTEQRYYLGRNNIQQPYIGLNTTWRWATPGDTLCWNINIDYRQLY